MPVGPFPNFESCSLHFAQDPDVDDPEEMCRYIENRSKEDDIMDGDKIIYGLDVQYMSLVDNPAVGDSIWLKSKKLQRKDRNDRQMKCKALDSGTNRGYFIKSQLDDDNYVVKAVALIPDKVDGNGEALSEAEIYKAMLKFMDYQNVDSQHDFIEGKGKVVMNWILDKEEQFELKNGGTATYPKGTWLVGVKVNDPKEWDKIKSGERTGFSIAGYWSAIEVKKVPSKADHTETLPETKETDNSPDSENQELTKETEVNPMEKEEIQNIIRSELESFKKVQAEEASQKEALAKEEKLSSELAEARKEIEELKKALESKEEEQKAEEDTEEDKPDEEKEEKADGEDDEEEADGPEEEEKSFEEKQLESRGVLHRTTPGAPGKKEKSGNMGVKSLINGYKSHMTKGD